MAHRLLSRISDQAVHRASSCVGIAVCLVVALGWSYSAMAQQGLKIRLVDAEQENPWDQKAMSIGADVLTPPGEAPSTQTLRNLSPLFAAKPSISEPSNMINGPLGLAPSETLPPSMLTNPMPGYLPGSKSGILNDNAASPLSPIESDSPPYAEPTYETYKQQQFQNRVFGIRKYLLTATPEVHKDGQEILGSGCPDDPRCIWRFSPFRRVRFLGHRLFSPSPSRTAFAKLFPWNRTPGRNQGVGEPLVNDSWLWAPFGVGWYMGYMDGTTFVNGWTGAKSGYFGGYHLNWDFDHYWGTEFRYGFASLAQWDTHLLYEAHGLPDPRFGKRHATLKYGDFSFLYYPWGDARWRPYAKMGIGWGYVKFTDLNYKLWSNSTMAIPMGVGLKYRYSRRIVFRIEMMDNFLFGERGINPQHNLSLTSGVEIRFGGARKAYWPYNPGRHYW